MAPALTYSASQLAGMSVAQLNALPVATLASLGAAQIQALSASQLNGLSAAAFQALNVTSLMTSQISHLTTALSNFSASQAGALTAAQVGNLSVSQVWALSGKMLSSMGYAAVAGLSTAQVQAISTSAMTQLSAAVINMMSPTQLAGLTKSEVQALTKAQIAGVSGTALNAINMSYLTSDQLGGLTASQVAGLSAANFQKTVAPNVASLGANGLSGLTQAQVASLAPTQISALATAPLTGAAKSFVTDFNAVMTTAQKDDVGGKMTFSSAQALLTSVTQGGMTAGKYAALQTVAGELNATSGPTVAASGMVKQLFGNVVNGTGENAYWTGGGTKSGALGNLSASSTQVQAAELIGKWFLGTDDPSLTGTMATGYAAQSGDLFSAAGPQASDVNQGSVGDCYFLAAVASEASQNPNAIKNMITSDGNGVYTVDFKLNGADDYVTVDNKMATLPQGYRYQDGSTLAFDNGGGAGKSIWTEVMEKAYVEFRGDTDAATKSAAAPQNSYAHVEGGWDEGIAAITGRPVYDYAASSFSTPSGAQALARILQTDIGGKDVVTMSTGNLNSNTGLVGDHMYAVLGVNAAAGTVAIDNPWNANASGAGVQTMSLAALVSKNVTFHASAGPTLFG